MPITLWDDQVREAGKMTKKDLIFSLVILLILLVAVPLLTGDEGDKDLLIWEENCLKLTFPDATTYTIDYEDITGICLVEAPDFGTCLDGVSSDKYRYGTWENEALGEYIACTYESFDTVIQVNTDAQTFWIGYDDSEATQLLYQGFLEILESE